MAGRDQAMEAGDCRTRLHAAVGRGRFGRLLLGEQDGGACEGQNGGA